MKTHTIELDENDLAVIAAGLGELPFKHSKATFDKISAQVAMQNAAQAEPGAGVPAAN